MYLTSATKYGIEMGDGTFEWYETFPLAEKMSKTPRLGVEKMPTGLIISRTVVTKIEEVEIRKREVSDVPKTT